MAFLPQGGHVEPDEPFVWGQGGKRLTPDQVERERQIAQSLMGVDYSPIQSPWQGLARLGGNVLGVLHERRADKAAGLNSAEDSAVLQGLLNPPASMSPAGEVPAVGGTPSAGPDIAAILSNPYIGDATRKLAMDRYAQSQKLEAPWIVNDQLIDRGSNKVLADFRTPQQGPEIVQLSQIANDPARPDYERAAARDRITALNDPFASIPLPGGQTYLGPRSGIGGALGGGQPSAPPSTLPKDFDFGGSSGGPTPKASAGFR